MIRLVTPTTDDARLAKVLNGASGYLYYVSITGVTGTKSFAEAEVAAALARIRKATDLPVAVGFGIRTPEQAAAIAAHRRWRGGGLGHCRAASRQTGAPGTRLVAAVAGTLPALWPVPRMPRIQC